MSDMRTVLALIALTAAACSSDPTTSSDGGNTEVASMIEVSLIWEGLTTDQQAALCRVDRADLVDAMATAAAGREDPFDPDAAADYIIGSLC